MREHEAVASPRITIQLITTYYTLEWERGIKERFSHEVSENILITLHRLTLHLHEREIALKI